MPRRRLPSHKYRRLHLNLPGLPEGAAFSIEHVEGAVATGIRSVPPEPGVDYSIFVDMSGGSADDATLAVAHLEDGGRVIVDLVTDQGRRPPFNPRRAVERFARVAKRYGAAAVTGDRYAGETFRRDFEDAGLSYRVEDRTKSQLYEALEPRLNAGEVALPDHLKLIEQLLGLVWRGNKIDHASGEHDDLANAAAGAVELAAGDVAESLDGMMFFNESHALLEARADELNMNVNEAPASIFDAAVERGDGGFLQEIRHEIEYESDY